MRHTTLSRHCGFEVLLPDLRGHGVAPATRGDVGYIGAFEDDLADLIAAYRRPEQPVYMVGHSSGGGLVVRFAGWDHGSVLSKAVLLSPFLKYDAPIMRDNAGGMEPCSCAPGHRSDNVEQGWSQDIERADGYSVSVSTRRIGRFARCDGDNRL